MNDYGPIWQLKENLKAKRLLVKAHTSDIARSQELLSKVMLEINQYENALLKLEETDV